MQHYHADDPDHDQYKVKCKCGKVGTYRADPYDLEIHGKLHMKWLCDDCYQERKDDI